MKRAAGILLHISSLPSPYGIGTLGKSAFDFVDFLHAAGQRYWQLLPLSPTGYGDSPYQSVSAFAGNSYFIDPGILCEQGLLLPEELPEAQYEEPDYFDLYTKRPLLFRKAFARADRQEIADFMQEKADWLPEYALFCAIKDREEGKPWYAWDDSALRFGDTEALAQARACLAEDILFHGFLQMHFFRQWQSLRAYAAKNGVQIIGDMPLYVPYDSVELWQNPDLYQLDENLAPTHVAGCPPDYFSADGQWWGNALYRWEAHAADGFAWWKRRLGAANQLYDVVRLDHFRGLSAYWSIPADAPTAAHGKWVEGPGKQLLAALREAHPNCRVIAEDLGVQSPELEELLTYSGFPGMRLIQCAFGGGADNPHLPHNHTQNCVVYTGTHDNATMMQWAQEVQPDELGRAVDYLGLNAREGLPFGFARGALMSVADLVIIPLQDYLGLGAAGRMNFPNFLGWWRYRAKTTDFSDALAERIRYYTEMFGR